MAKKALARKTGARGLRSIVEAILLDTMYDLPSLQHLEKSDCRSQHHYRQSTANTRV